MKPHEQRVLLEMEELVAKLSKLEAFRLSPIHANLPQDERLRLKRQLLIMYLYVDVLQERIAHFPTSHGASSV